MKGIRLFYNQRFRTTDPHIYFQSNIFEPLTPLDALSSFQYAAWFPKLWRPAVHLEPINLDSVQMSVLTHICIAAVHILWAVMYMREELDFSVFAFALVCSLNNLQVVLHRVERVQALIGSCRISPGPCNFPSWDRGTSRAVPVLDWGVVQAKGWGRSSLAMIFLRHNHNNGYYFRMWVVFSAPTVVMAICNLQVDDSANGGRLALAVSVNVPRCNAASRSSFRFPFQSSSF
jgi:hypothetical protein